MDHFNLDSIPSELRDRPQWVAWVTEPGNGPKPRKKPISPVTGMGASCTKPTDWTDFDDAVSYAQDHDMTGVMFAITSDDPYVGIDLDECRDPESGELNPQARDIIETFSTYAEVSPSRTGIKLIGRGQKPDGARCKSKAVDFKEIEVYDHARFFTITSDVYGDHAEVRDVGHETVELCEQWLMPATMAPSTTQEPVVPADPDDDALINKIEQSAQGSGFIALWSGNTSDYNGDRSSADYAMARMLAFWTQRDAQRIERIMRRSGLDRAKWDTPRGEQTYLQYTITNAVEATDTVYDPDFTNTGNSTEPAPSCPAMVGTDVDDSEFHDEDNDSFGDHLQSVINGERRPVLFPWTSLNVLTRALTPGSLTILVGSPGASKSLIMAQAMTHWHEAGIDARCLMLEGDKNFHLRRAFAQKAGESRLTDDQWVEENDGTVNTLYNQHQTPLADLSSKIDVPHNDQPVSPAQVHTWLKEHAATGARVLIVDPITMIDGGKEQWTTDRHLVTYALRIAEKHKLSIILVTHPRKGARKPHLDDVAGGATISRMSHNVLWLERLKKQKLFTMMGPNGLLEGHTDRLLHVLKARSGHGGGRQIGVMFDRSTLCIDMPGVIVANEAEDPSCFVCQPPHASQASNDAAEPAN